MECKQVQHELEDGNDLSEENENDNFIWKYIQDFSPFYIAGGFYMRDDKRHKILDMTARLYCFAVFCFFAFKICICLVDMLLVSNCVGRVLVQTSMCVARESVYGVECNTVNDS